MSSAPAVQLSFALRTSSSVRSVHLVGSWDNYTRQLPLSMIKDGSAKPGSWKGTFRFQGSQSLKLGSRYWYYYIIDGYQVSHDPAKESVVEKTTGRKLNILNVPAGKTTSAKPAALTVQTKNLSSVATGRSLSPTRIACPRPQKPYASRQLREADYEHSPIDDLEERFGATSISPSRRYVRSPSEVSDVSSSGSSSGSEFSDISSAVSGRSECRCVGVTRDGRRVKIDCRGSRCSYDSSDCSDSESEDEVIAKRAARAAQASRSSRRAVRA